MTIAEWVLLIFVLIPTGLFMWVIAAGALVCLWELIRETFK